ncbi:hypothetical protein FMEAI12_2020005 [Parafrankia sp. Ea1.12]|nr:hypothetical protein FMEAI12_2020005 [Parafrankia sp. Ea1.12]
MTQRGAVERIALSGAGDLDAAAGAAEPPRDDTYPKAAVRPSGRRRTGAPHASDIAPSGGAGSTARCSFGTRK